MAGLLFLHFNYANLCNTIFSLFACYDYDYGDRVLSLLKEDLTISCYSPRHRAMQMYGIVTLFIFPIGVPMMYLSLMNYHRTRMDYTYYRGHIKNGYRLNEQQLYQLRATDPVTRSFGFLYSQYNDRNYWFEVVECGRKMLLCGLVVLLAPGTPSQYTLCMLIFFCLFTFIAYFRPYHSNLDSQIALVCYVTTFVTYVVTFLISYEEDGKGVAKLPPWSISALLFAATMLPLLAGLQCFYEQASDQYKAYKQKKRHFNNAIDERVAAIVSKRNDLKCVAGSAATKWLKKIGKKPTDPRLPKLGKERREKLRKEKAAEERARLIAEGKIMNDKAGSGILDTAKAAGSSILNTAKGMGAGMLDTAGNMLDQVGQVSPFRDGGSPSKAGFSDIGSFGQIAIGARALEKQQDHGFGRADGDGTKDTSARRAATVGVRDITDESEAGESGGGLEVHAEVPEPVAGGELEDRPSGVLSEDDKPSSVHTEDLEGTTPDENVML
eukprot:CAMPEP_0205910140 /NCGR_PEP_ID=MMETSP1325-20131115/4269_1 /ASSEMBLY_ACC=CAM_ASM_000708 /TAXON_ID=236786 /ORGANISM="Florenciella sp., Strain RCC1007" /LENGTH=495 /DNA_ID=CAMNT_0053276471 /DNA_START=51 /DNA_END=1538 /DNA_ORIENTATION=-